MMRAKVRVESTKKADGYVQETVVFVAVAKNSTYPEDGSDENNTYVKFTPMARFEMAIQNPNLIGKFEIGQEFYVDFTPVAK